VVADWSFHWSMTRVPSRWTRMPSSAVAVKVKVKVSLPVVANGRVATQRAEKLSGPTPAPVGPPGPQSLSTAASQRLPAAAPERVW